MHKAKSMTTIHWKSALSGLFGTATDWNPSLIPGAADNAIIDAAGVYTVTSPTSRTVKTLSTAKGATLAVTAGVFTATSGTGTGSNAGTIRVGNGAALAIGGTFANAGTIALNSTGRSTFLGVIGNTTLAGFGSVTLSPSGHNFIVSEGTAATLVNAGNTISGAGEIGDPHLTLVNQTRGIIDGNSATAALTLDTNGALALLTNNHTIANAGLIEGTSAEGLVIVSNVSNSGELLASGTGARLALDGVIDNIVPVPLGRFGFVAARGQGAHVDLSSATISNGGLQVGAGSVVETVANSGLSLISGVTVVNSGALQANSGSELRIQGSNIGATGALISNGAGALLDVDGAVGAVSATIDGGEIEFKGGSAAKVAFDAGAAGTLKLDDSTAFTGVISGFAGVAAGAFSQFLAFGDSSIDSGSLQYLSTGDANMDARISNGVANGGTGSPVGVGFMNSQFLAEDLGLTANSAYAPGGGTNYAISGALNSAFPGDGSIGNLFPNASLPSTADQISNYLSTTKDANGVAHADSNALYLVSSGGNDVALASNDINGLANQDAYVDQAAANLTTAIQQLYAAGAQHVMVENQLGDKPLQGVYSTALFADLDAAGVPALQIDGHSMLDAVKADPLAFGIDYAAPGVPGKTTESALIEPNQDSSGSPITVVNGWGLTGADTTAPDSIPSQAQAPYAYLRSADAEQKSLFSDDQHLSTAGQLIQANFDYGVLVGDKAISQDALDLADIAYGFGTTKATYAGTAAGGTLSVTDGSHTANITLSGNYLGSTFLTTNDGGLGTLVVDQGSAASHALLASHNVAS
jgi:hypothetical protein